MRDNIKMRQKALQIAAKLCLDWKILWRKNSNNFYSFFFQDISSKAIYVYIFSRQKFIKNAKNCQFWRVYENPKFAVKQCYQTGHY